MNSPHNPTGRVYTPETLTTLAEALTEMGYEASLPEGTFYAMARSPITDVEAGIPRFAAARRETTT